MEMQTLEQMLVEVMMQVISLLQLIFHIAHISYVENTKYLLTDENCEECEEAWAYVEFLKMNVSKKV